MSNKRLEEIEIDIARHIKNPHYRVKFVKDGYAKILLQRVEDWVGSRFLTEDAADFIEYFNRCTLAFIQYISTEYTDAIVKFNINTDGTYYLTFNSDGVKIKDEFTDLVHDYRIIFERCYDDAKSRQLNKTEEEITYSIKDEDKKGSFIFDTEAKTLFNLITEYRRRCMKEETDEAVNQYAEFIRIIYGIQPNIDRRTLKSLKIKRIDDHIDHIARTDLPIHSEPYRYNISSNAQLNELFDWVAQQVQNETNQEARQAYSRVLDAIAVISDEDRFNRLSIDEKIAVMHFLEDNKS
jgi:hypothetical protein